ncbi:MAG: hypothetical protein KKD44_28510 [Proteobacteria bacterium]|nr:hypothetical protein [Pseudomonadota bacterium]
MPGENETRPVNLKHIDKAVWVEMRQYRIASGMQNMEQLIEDMWKFYKKTTKV